MPVQHELPRGQRPSRAATSRQLRSTRQALGNGPTGYARLLLVGSPGQLPDPGQLGRRTQQAISGSDQVGRSPPVDGAPVPLAGRRPCGSPSRQRRVGLARRKADRHPSVNALCLSASAMNGVSTSNVPWASRCLLQDPRRRPTTAAACWSAPPRDLVDADHRATCRHRPVGCYRLIGDVIGVALSWADHRGPRTARRHRDRTGRPVSS